MIAFTEARMHLAVELGGAGRHPGAFSRAGVDRDRSPDPAWLLGLTRDAASRGLDLVILADAFRPAEVLPGVVDVVASAAAIAPVVPSIGLVPQVSTADSEPFLLSKAVAMLDVASSGRAGWEPVVPGSTTGAGLVASTDLLWREAGVVIEAVNGLWTAAGDEPAGRPPKPLPLTVIRADDPEALDVAARFADVVRIAAPGLDVARTARDRVRHAAAAAGRDPDDLTVLLDVEVHLATDAAAARSSLRHLDAQAGELPPSSLRVVGSAPELANLVERTVSLRAADGITFLPLVLPTDLLVITGAVVPLLAGRGLFRTGRPGTGLRTRFRPRQPLRNSGGAA
jgi:alkanesulfonate monooxygenase SsuD/methylene tetrahydromethanopterin reductase-like flavin-dependent oxidoreductase (luciferase family)